MTSTLRDSPRPPSWEGAACRGHNPEWWFPPESGWHTGPREAQARAICRRCPLVKPCAEYAIAISDLSGLWGGLSAAERRQIRRRRAPVAAGVCRCGCAYLDHRLRWAPGRRKGGSCMSCDCDEYAGADGG